jgi:8-oxo-dGTP diphosphatase
MVVGFMFWHTNVLLVKKLKPAWQHGYWNGVGGKIEPNESDAEAMVREFKEETGISTSFLDWTKFCEESGPPDYHATFFKTRVGAIPGYSDVNDVGEPLSWLTTRSLDNVNVIGNLRWLIPLAQDWRRHTPVTVTVLDDIREKATW